MPFHWKPLSNDPGHPPDELVTLTLSIDDRLVFERVTSFANGECEVNLLIPAGICRVNATVKDRATSTFLIDSSQDSNVDLRFGRELGEKDEPVAPFRINYHVFGLHAPGLSLTGKGSPELSSESSFLIEIHFYREDTGLPQPEAEELDLPLRICLDQNVVYDGVARAGNLVSFTLFARAGSGLHNLFVEVPGMIKQRKAIQLSSNLWVSLYFFPNTRPRLRTDVANGVIPAF